MPQLIKGSFPELSSSYYLNCYSNCYIRIGDRESLMINKATTEAKAWRQRPEECQDTPRLRQNGLQMLGSPRQASPGESGWGMGSLRPQEKWLWAWSLLQHQARECAGKGGWEREESLALVWPAGPGSPQGASRLFLPLSSA